MTNRKGYVSKHNFKLIEQNLRTDNRLARVVVCGDSPKNRDYTTIDLGVAYCVSNKICTVTEIWTMTIKSVLCYEMYACNTGLRSASLHFNINHPVTFFDCFIFIPFVLPPVLDTCRRSNV